MPPVLVHSYLVYIRDGVKYAVPCLKSSEATLLSYWLELRGIDSVTVPSGHASESVLGLPRDVPVLFQAAREVYDSGVKHIKVWKLKYLIGGTARRLTKPSELAKSRFEYQEIRRINNGPRDYRKSCAI